MTDDRPVLVIGGTRGTGLLIARLLHDRGVPVRVLARDRARALTLFDGAAIDVVSGDLTGPDTLPAAITGTSHIVFTAGCPKTRFAAAASTTASFARGRARAPANHNGRPSRFSGVRACRRRI